MRTQGFSSRFHLSFAVLLSFLLFARSSYTHSKPKVLSPVVNISAQDLDLVGFLNAKTSEQDVIFAEAIQLLESMKSSPSCNRIAAAKLLASCKSTETGKGERKMRSVTSLDRVKSVYAARLALCEITEAGTAIPSSCSPLYISVTQKRTVPVPINGRQQDPEQMDSTPTASLDSCLKALESRPQWWTSYSNSRQNAMVICQAARVEVEKEELLELHRSIAENTLRLNRGLQDAIRNAAAESAQHKAFIHTTDLIQTNLLHELEETGSRTRHMFTTLVNEVEIAVGAAITSIVSLLRGVEADATVLQEEIRDATREVDRLQDGLRATHEETLKRNAELAQTRQRDAEANEELAVSIRSSLNSLLTEDVAKLSESVEGFGGSLQWLTESLSLIYQQEHLILERLKFFETSLDESELKAESLRKAQILQSEALKEQSHAQEALGKNVQIAQALLDRVTATAANLQATVEGTATGFKSLPAFGGMLGAYFPWSLCSLIISAIAAQHPRTVVCLLFLCYGALSVFKLFN